MSGRFFKSAYFQTDLVLKLALFAVLLSFSTQSAFSQDGEGGSGGSDVYDASLHVAQGEQEIHERIRSRALTVSVNARILENDQELVWQENHQRHTISGNPVSIKLVGSNLVVVVQFTPFVRPQGGSVLVAHGQTWLEIPGAGIRYHTSIKTIPLELDEPIIFFPLGDSRNSDVGSNSRIEIMVTTMRYRETAPAVVQEGD